jgi:hypothetical protein
LLFLLFFFLSFFFFFFFLSLFFFFFFPSASWGFVVLLKLLLIPHVTRVHVLELLDVLEVCCVLLEEGLDRREVGDRG